MTQRRSSLASFLCIFSSLTLAFILFTTRLQRIMSLVSEYLRVCASVCAIISVNTVSLHLFVFADRQAVYGGTIGIDKRSNQGMHTKTASKLYTSTKKKEEHRRNKRDTNS